jgi:hypothetical protein
VFGKAVLNNTIKRTITFMYRQHLTQTIWSRYE